MSFARNSAETSASGVGIAPTLEALSAIHHPGCAAVLWQRQLSSELLTWLDQLPTDQLPKTRVILHPSRVEETLSQICDNGGTPDCVERDILVKDVSQLALTFAGIMQSPYVRLRLDRITTNACRRFHIDAVTARLVCTYRGTGTQYGKSSEGRDPSHIFTVPTGSPILLRGTLWPGPTEPSLLHRSPPIEGTGETRSVLVLDPIHDLETEVRPAETTRKL